jgi:hypothetical protein
MLGSSLPKVKSRNSASIGNRWTFASVYHPTAMILSLSDLTFLSFLSAANTQCSKTWSYGQRNESTTQ